MARTIGPRWKREVKRLVSQARAKGLEGVGEITRYVHENLPLQVYTIWESAYNEIENLVDEEVFSERRRTDTTAGRFGRVGGNPRRQRAFRERFVSRHVPERRRELGEHDPHQHGCKYIGNNTWDCGHIDGLGPDERCDCDWCQGTFVRGNPSNGGANEAVVYSKGGDNYIGVKNSAPLLFWKEYGRNRNLGRWLYIGYRNKPYSEAGMDQVVVYDDKVWDWAEFNRRQMNGFLGITAHDLSKPGVSPNPRRNGKIVKGIRLSDKEYQAFVKYLNHFRVQNFTRDDVEAFLEQYTEGEVEANPIDHYKRLARYMQSDVEVRGPMRTGEYGDATEKRRFRTIGIGAMKQLAKDLGMREWKADFNPGGPAVSGDVHLMGMFNDKIGLHMFFSKDQWGHTPFGDMTYRTIKHMKDYTGGSNQWMHSSEFLNPDMVISKLRMFVERQMGYQDA